MKSRRSCAASMLLGALLLVATSTLVHGADVDREQYKWAVSFSIQNDFTLRPHEAAGGISVSRIISEKSAIRASEFIEYRHQDDMNPVTNITSVLYLRSVRPERRAHFYWGAGPWIAYDRPGEAHSVLQIGVAGVLGIEAMATDYLGLHAEYRINSSYLRYRYSPSVVKETYYLNAGDSAIFGLSVYF